MVKRKERAKAAKEWEEKQKEMTPEELDAYMESIPEWKRGALVVDENEEELDEEKPGIFGRMKNRVQSRIDETEMAKKFYESEDYQKLKEVRAEVKEFRAEMREQVDASQNPMVQRASQLSDKVLSETACALAITHMK